jgi:hypothetical protein
VIVRDLRAVTVAGAVEFGAEADAMLAWTRERLAACGAPAAGGPTYEVKKVAPGATSSLELGLAYSDGRRFQWRADFAHGGSYFESTIGGSRKTLPMSTGLLSTEASLGEAIFY